MGGRLGSTFQKENWTVDNYKNGGINRNSWLFKAGIIPFESEIHYPYKVNIAFDV